MAGPILTTSRTRGAPQGRATHRWSSFLHGVLGIGIFLLSWFLLVDLLGVWRFAQLPLISVSLKEMFSVDPTYGVSVFTREYYQHLVASCWRVIFAFLIAVSSGVVIGILAGWSRWFHAIIIPLLELARPIPVLAWIPLVILVMPSRESSVIALTFLAAFFITILNTLLGVRSIDEVYFRAARSLGFSRWAVLRHIVVPGALPYIFVGLQIAMAACWFSLVASEIVSGTAGLGYKVWEAYYYVQFETMVIMILTLGVCGYISSAAIRRVGDYLMRWRSKGLGGTS